MNECANEYLHLRPKTKRNAVHKLNSSLANMPVFLPKGHLIEQECPLADKLLTVSVFAFVCPPFALSPPVCSGLSLSSYRWIHVAVGFGKCTGLDQ